ncbi:MAG: diphthine synthase [Candidatus Aenigmarchaeota archaeon]|nr:diphthine synthase [Candidatus Aenigmarchaeota archaeon]MCK5321759.1 diphthine synthase [Candidatus Aenigmarchaeota archaeon]
MLYLIGIGIENEMGLSLRALKIMDEADHIFAEFYTCPIDFDKNKIENVIGKKIKVLDRKGVEETSWILDAAKMGKTVFLVGGDPLAATTHSEIVKEAREEGVKVKIIHNSSVFSAVAEAGLHLYKFGKTVSLPFPKEGYFPDSPYYNIFENSEKGLHTLLLLDIGMSANKGIELLLELEEKCGKELFSKKKKIIVCAHLGEKSYIKYSTMADLLKRDFGDHPHCIVVPGEMHFQEEEFLKQLE